MAKAKLVAPSSSRSRKVGAVVEVDASRVDALLARGFTKPTAKTTAKKASSSKSTKK